MKHLCWTCIVCAIISTVTLCFAHTDYPIVLLISMDGFRWDYLDIAAKYGVKTPNFKSLVENGVLGKIQPVYPTKTMPNHWSIITGLYTESHGIVDNVFTDPKLGNFSNYASTKEVESKQTLDSRWFDIGSEPIWVTNQKQSCNHKSGVYFWPSCAAPVKNIVPTYYRRLDVEYNEAPWHERIDKVIMWFTQKEINLGVLYFEEPDVSGHKFGPDSPGVANIIGQLDEAIGYLMKKLQKFRLFYRVNIIITADHGMTPVQDTKSAIELDRTVSREWYISNYEWPEKPIWPKAGKEDLVYKALKKIKNLSVYRKENIPENYHYKHSPRIAPIIIESDPGIPLVFNLTEAIERRSKKNKTFTKGQHGNNNSLSDMQAIFIAHGPAFKQGYTTARFRIVDLYPLMCHILQLDAAPNNGSLQKVKDILSVSKQWSNVPATVITFLVVVVLCTCVAAVFMIGACRVKSSHKHVRRTIAMQFLNQSEEASVSLLISDGDEDSEVFP